MIIVRRSILWPVLATLLISSPVYAANDSPINLADYSDIEEFGHVVRIFDIDGDGIDEITNIRHINNSILIYSLSKGQYTDIYLPSDVTIINVDYSDILPDPDHELIVNCRIDTGHIFYIFADIFGTYGHNALVDSVFFADGEDIMPPEGWDGYYHFLGSYDVNGDYNPDLIFRVNTGWDKYPREIFAYDLRDRKKIWTYPSANTLQLIGLTDVNGDQVPEIILSGDAPGNNSIKGNQTDDRSRLIILNIKNAKEWWMYEFDKYSRECEVALSPVHSNGHQELYAAVSYVFGEKPDVRKTRQAELYRFDLTAKKVMKSIMLDGVAGRLYPYKSHGNHSVEFAFASSDGMLRVYDNELNLREERKFSWKLLLLSVDDINMDGYPEYFLITSKPEALILNKHLEKEVSYEDQCFVFSPLGEWLAKINSGKPERLFLNGVNASGDEVNRAFLVPDIPPVGRFTYYIWFISRHKDAIALGIAFGLLAFWVLLLNLRNSKNRNFYKTVIGDNNLGVMHVVNGRLVKANRKAGILLGFEIENLKNKKMLTLLEPSGLENLKNHLQDLTILSTEDSHIVNVNVDGKSNELEIRPVVIKSRKGKPHEYLLIISEPDISKRDWLALARGIAHDIKSPGGLASTQLSSLAADIRSSKDPNQEETIEKIDRANANIKRSLDRISMFAGIVKELDVKPERTNINKYLRDYVMIRKVSIPKGSTLRFEPGLSISGVLLDPQYFASALDNLLDNAIDALSSKDTGAITISSGVDNILYKTQHGETLKKSVRISISDTGSGIPKDSLPYIFNLDFTSKKGKGLGMGLYQHRHGVFRIFHKGQIDVQFHFPQH